MIFGEVVGYHEKKFSPKNKFFSPKLGNVYNDQCLYLSSTLPILTLVRSSDNVLTVVNPTMAGAAALMCNLIAESEKLIAESEELNDHYLSVMHSPHLSTFVITLHAYVHVCALNYKICQFL